MTDATPPLRSVCVYMGSSSGRRPAYQHAAAALGAEIAQRGAELVYGGGCVGLMGVTADAALAAGGAVHGVITRSLQRREVGHDGLTELHVVETMHERKAAMARRADAFVALPGGLGTLDEFFEIITWLQLGLHAKPCALLNVDGYFDGLITFLRHSVAERFVHEDHVARLIIEHDAGALLDAMQRFRASPAQNWLG